MTPEIFWEDDTVYSSGKEPGSPRVFAMTVEGMRVAVHRKLGCLWSEWYLTCHPLQIVDYRLPITTVDAYEAVQRVALEEFLALASEREKILARIVKRCKDCMTWQPRE